MKAEEYVTYCLLRLVSRELYGIKNKYQPRIHLYSVTAKSQKVRNKIRNMGRMREATITMGVLLLTTTLMLILLQILRIVVEQDVDLKILIYVSFAICVWGIIAEIVLICAASKRKTKVLVAWVVLAVMRALAHSIVGIIMMIYELNYPTVILCCYMFILSLALALASWRAILFVRVLRSEKGEIDDYGYCPRKTPIGDRIVRMLPYTARKTTTRPKDSLRQAPGGAIEPQKSLAPRKNVPSASTTAESGESTTEPGDSASSTHSSYSDEPRLATTSSTDSPSSPHILNYPPRMVHSPPRPRPHPSVSRKIISPPTPIMSPSPVTSPEYPVKPRPYKRPSTPAPAVAPTATTGVRHLPNVRYRPQVSPLRNKLTRRVYRKTTISTVEIDDSANELTTTAIKSDIEQQPSSTKSPTQEASETAGLDKDESAKKLDLDLDVLHRIAKHCSQDKLNSQFGDIKKSVVSPKICKQFEAFTSSTETNVSTSDSEEVEPDLKLPDNSELKLNQKASQGKVSEIIAGFEEKSYNATNKTKQMENKIFHDRVSKDDSFSGEDKSSLEFSKHLRATSSNTLLTNVLKQETPITMSQNKNTRSDTKLAKPKFIRKGRPKSTGRMQTTSEQRSTSGNRYISEDQPSIYIRQYVKKERKDAGQNTEETKPPHLDSPTHFGDTSATSPLKQSDPRRTHEYRKLRGTKVVYCKARRRSSERRDSSKPRTVNQGTIVRVHGGTKRPEFERGSSPRIEDPKPRSRTRTKKPLTPETRAASTSKSPGQVSRRNRGRNPENATAHGTILRMMKKKRPSPGIHANDKSKRDKSMWPLSDAEEDSLTTFEATQVRAAIRVASRQRQLELQKAAAVAKAMMRREEGSGGPKVRKAK